MLHVQCLDVQFLILYHGLPERVDTLVNVSLFAGTKHRGLKVQVPPLTSIFTSPLAFTLSTLPVCPIL